MFGIVFSYLRAEPDKPNMFFRKFSAFIFKTYFTIQKKSNFILEPIFYFWSYLILYFFGQTEIKSNQIDQFLICYQNVNMFINLTYNVFF